MPNLDEIGPVVPEFFKKKKKKNVRVILLFPYYLPWRRPWSISLSPKDA